MHHVIKNSMVNLSIKIPVDERPGFVAIRQHCCIKAAVPLPKGEFASALFHPIRPVIDPD
jgi:hypothetical protein